MTHPIAKAIMIVGLVWLGSAHAQQQGMPSNAELAHEMERIEAERKAMFNKSDALPSNMPNAFPHIPTPAASKVDIATLARRYDQKERPDRRDEAMLFASFTMPAPALQRLVAAASRVGVAVIFRGFKNNSLKDTNLAIRALGQRDGALQINPNAFTKYQVSSVPMLVLVKTEGQDQLDANGCALPDAFVSVAGDVSLDFALESIEQRSPEFAPIAARILRQYRGGQ